MKQALKVYSRMVDGGHGRHQLVVDESSKVIEQTLHAVDGQGHVYTGDGNPEFVGMTIRQVNKACYGQFKRERMTDNQYNHWLEKTWANRE